MLIPRFTHLPNPRTSCSGNSSATNVLRFGGKLAAPGMMIFDILKGLIPVWIGYLIKVPPFWLGLVAISACCSDIYMLLWRQTSAP